ncbi:hypothetical protein [Mycolicibacterium sp. P9-64]|nr:hypothetical protein [Mycolicibacterium sp. P9-64]
MSEIDVRQLRFGTRREMLTAGWQPFDAMHPTSVRVSERQGDPDPKTSVM